MTLQGEQMVVGTAGRLRIHTAVAQLQGQGVCPIPRVCAWEKAGAARHHRSPCPEPVRVSESQISVCGAGLAVARNDLLHRSRAEPVQTVYPAKWFAKGSNDEHGTLAYLLFMGLCGW